MSNYKFLKTERLIIIPTSIEDPEFILELVNTPKWLKYIGDRNIKTIESAKEYIQDKILPQLEKLGFSNYTIMRKSDKIKMGTCGLYDRPGLEGVDLWFAFIIGIIPSEHYFGFLKSLQLEFQHWYNKAIHIYTQKVPNRTQCFIRDNPHYNFLYSKTPSSKI